MKWYLTAATAPITNIPATTGWELSSGMIRRALLTTMSGTNAAATVAETSTSNVYDVCLYQGVSPPMLRAGNIGGALTLMVAILSSSTLADMVTYVQLYVTVGDTAAVRGSMMNGNYTNAWPTTATGRSHGNAGLATVACQAGDRVVVEIGYRARNTVSTSYSGTIRYGGTAGDLAASDTGTVATTRSGFLSIVGQDTDDLWTPPTARTGDHFHTLAA